MTKALGFSFKPFRKMTALSKKSSTSIDYLDGILRNDPKILELIYDQNLGTITRFVLNNNGSRNDARDVFQDGLMIIYNKVKAGNLELTASFGTYLFSVCRFVWLKELKKKHRQQLPLDNIVELSAQMNLEEDWNKQEQKKLFRAKMQELSLEEQKVLQLFFNGNSMKEIAETMNYTLAYAQRKKYLAKNKLIKLVQNSTVFHQL